MPVLSDAKRKEVWSDHMRTLSRLRISTGTMTKTQLREIVDDVDKWITDNKVSFNNGIRATHRSLLPNGEKARLLSVLALKRFVEGV